ncbi:hypothetical protein HK105_208769 [Polyrhizophydium stewartii]|uniref:Uncharacterized protein n=1 Tax=Polyrhizophydium stewartii TaxID=2732419 RepID=A0ABR4MWZ5_9FUNG
MSSDVPRSHRQSYDLGVPLSRGVSASLTELALQPVGDNNSSNNAAPNSGSSCPPKAGLAAADRADSHGIPRNPKSSAALNVDAHEHTGRSKQPPGNEARDAQHSTHFGLVSFEDECPPPSLLKLRARLVPAPQPEEKARPPSPPPPADPPKPPTPPPPKPSPKKDAELIAELRDLVHRQDLLLLWFSSKHPGPGSSSLSEFFETAPPERHPVATITKVYDSRLAETEAQLRTLQDSYSSEMEKLRSEHRKELHEQETRHEAALEHLRGQLAASQEATKRQSSTIEKLADAAKILEAKTIQVTDRLEKSFRSNRLLMDKASELDTLCIETERKLMDCARERDRAQRWVRAYQGSVEDYESCVRESGLAAILHEDVMRDVAPGSLLLTRHVKNMIREMQELNKKVNKLEGEIERVKKQHAGSLQRYMLDLERARAELLSTKDHLQQVISTADGAKSERDAALEQLQRLTRDVVAADENLRRVQREKDEQLAEVSARSQQQLKALREQFDGERHGLQMQLDEIKKAKIELQVEVGQLSRERRAATLDLEAVHRVSRAACGLAEAGGCANIAAQSVVLSREQFRRDLGIA